MEDAKKKLSPKPRSRALIAIAGGVVVAMSACVIGEPVGPRPDASVDAQPDAEDPIGVPQADASVDVQPDEPVGLPAPDAG